MLFDTDPVLRQLPSVVRASEEKRSDRLFNNLLKRNRSDLELAYTEAARFITPDLFWQVAQRVSEVRRPSGMVPNTLGLEMIRIVDDLVPSLKVVTFEQNYRGTKNPAITVADSASFNRSGIHVMGVAQGDEISYVPRWEAEDFEGKAIVVWPLCAHRQDPKEIGATEIRFPAEAVAYKKTDLGMGYGENVASGELVTILEESKRKIYFIPADQGIDLNEIIQPWIKIVLNPLPGQKTRLIQDPTNPDLVMGNVDNSIGDAAWLTAQALMAILHLKYPDRFRDLQTTLVHDDWEEGHPDGMFGKGAFDLAKSLEGEDVKYIVTDGHDSPGIDAIPGVALISDVVSEGKSYTLSEERAYNFQQLMSVIQNMGGEVDWDMHRRVVTSRSSEWGLKMAGVSDEDMAVIGYAEIWPHQNNGKIARASISGGTHLARFLVPAIIAAGRGLL